MKKYLLIMELHDTFIYQFSHLSEVQHYIKQHSITEYTIALIYESTQYA